MSEVVDVLLGWSLEATSPPTVAAKVGAHPTPTPKPKPKPVPNQVVKQQKKGAQNITVAVRVRPLTKAERDKHAYSTTKVLD